ncbi:MAG TPA: radical SAM protein [Polyangia bacterium]|nr:radical SAM protein [Polyangia bacterium]
MKIYLISPTHYLPDGALAKHPYYWTSAITLPYLAALTPREHQVSYVDEIIADVDLDAEVDVVGLTAMGPQIARAYDLADHFRRRGKKVVLGGSWVSLQPLEALEHADAVVVGEAEKVWPAVLADLAAGHSRGLYRASEWADLADLPRVDYTRLPLFRRDLWRRSRFYRMYFHWPVSASRGCPHPCEYCTVQTYYERTFRSRPVADVVEDFRTIRALGGRRVLILDDNPIGNPSYAKELFRALIPLKMEWASQCTINIARSDELLDLAARSGCRTLSIGFESISQDSLESVGKGFNRAPRFVEDIRKIRSKGIQIIALVMVGLDQDDEGSFQRTLEFLVKNQITFLKLFTPCPYPGTKYHAEMERAGRILSRDWRRYDYGSPLIRPARMSPERMMEGFNWLYREFYSLPSIARRMLPPPRGNYLESAFYTVANLKVHRYLRKTPFAWGTIS